MAEYKQYITQTEENGNVLISEDVVGAIVGHAVDEVEGAAGIYVKPGNEVADLIGEISAKNILHLYLPEELQQLSADWPE